MGQSPDGDPATGDGHPFTSVRRDKLARKEIFRPAGMANRAPVTGFRPQRALRALTLKVPNPEREIFPLSRRVSRIAITKVFKARAVCDRVTPAPRDTR